MEYFIDIIRPILDPVYYVAYECESRWDFCPRRELFRGENRVIVENELLQYIKEHEEPVG